MQSANAASAASTTRNNQPLASKKRDEIALPAAEAVYKLRPEDISSGWLAVAHNAMGGR